MTEHKGLPVSGYLPQTDDKVAIVNANKELEERCLRAAEALLDNPDVCVWMVHEAMTGLQQSFMWLNRAVFQPSRVKLPEDGA